MFNDPYSLNPGGPLGSLVGTVQGLPADGPLPASQPSSLQNLINPDSLSASTPSPQDALSALPKVPKIKRPGFLDRITMQPGGNDALVAFGAGLLSGKNLQEGLGIGLQAYLQAINAAKPKYSLMKDGEFTVMQPDTGPPTVTENTNVTQRHDEKAQISQQYQIDRLKLHDQNFMDQLKLRFANQLDVTRLIQDAENGRSDAQRQVSMMIAQMQNQTTRDVAAGNNKTTLEAARIHAFAGGGASGKGGKGFLTPEQAQSNEQVYQGIEGLLDKGSTAAGPGVVNSLRRGIAGAAPSLGGTVGVNTPDMQKLNTFYKQLELRASLAMQGQGQITEGERRIIRESTPNIQTDPGAAKALISVLRDIDHRNTMRVDPLAMQGDAMGGGSPAPARVNYKQKYGLR